MATFYVATAADGGNNANAGTSLGAPKLTVAAGIALLTPAAGDTLLIRAGIYAESITSCPAGTTYANAATISNYNSESVTIQPTGASNRALNLTGNTNKYLIWTGIIFDGASATIADVIKLSNSGGSPDTVPHHIRFINCEMKNCSRDSNGCFVNADDIDFIGCNIHDNYSHGAVVNNIGSHGIYAAGFRLLVDGCTIHDNVGLQSYGIQMYPGGGSHIIRNSVFYGQQNRAAFYMYGGNDTAYNNIIHDCPGGGMQTAGFGGHSLYNNTVYNCGYGVQNDVNGTVIKNNILYHNINPGTGLDAPLIGGFSQTYLNNVTVNPLFVDSTPTDPVDFKLQSGTPCDGVGADLSATFVTDIIGITRTTPWDAGAYVFGGVPSTPIDDFNYTTSSTLAGLNSGSGWTAAWASVGTGAMSVEVGPFTGGASGNAVRSQTTTGTTDYRRPFSTVATGIIRWYMQLSVTNPNHNIGPYFLQGSSGLFYVEFTASGMINTNGNDMQSFSANTQYLIDIQLDAVNQPNQYRVRVDGGTWTAWINGFASFSGVDGFGIEDLSTTAHTFWLDAIGAPSTLIPVTGFGLNALLNAPAVTAGASKIVTGFGLTMGLGVPIAAQTTAVAVSGFGLTASVGTPTQTAGATIHPTGFGLTAGLGIVTVTTDSGVSKAVSGFGLATGLGVPTIIQGASHTTSVSGFGLTMDLGVPAVTSNSIQVPVAGFSLSVGLGLAVVRVATQSAMAIATVTELTTLTVSFS